MNKKQFKNLKHSFRWMRNKDGYLQALAWIGHYSLKDRRILERIYYLTKQEK